MLNAIIIDDEADDCNNINDILQLHFHDRIRILDAVHSTSAAEVYMTQKTVDLFFVDIDMPTESGISFVGRKADEMKNVVFVTAYDQYAIDAFKLHAVDYILKPVDGDEFVRSIQHILDHTFAFQPNEIQHLAKQLYAREEIDVMILRDKQEATKIKISDIIYIEAEKAYSKIVYKTTKNNQSFIASYNLSHYEELLAPHDFIRVHKSYLINKKLIYKFVIKDSIVVLSQDIKIPVSRRRQSFLNKTI